MKEVLKLIVILVLATVAAVIMASRSDYNKNDEQLQQSVVTGKITGEITPTKELTDKERLSQCESDKMCKYLAEAGYFESKGESNVGVEAVMFVVLQRVADEKRWPNTVKGVLRQPAQFSYVSDGSLERGVVEKKRYKEIMIIAHRVLNGDTINPVPKANHFHTTKLKRVWTKNMRVVAVIGNHVFFEG